MDKVISMSKKGIDAPANLPVSKEQADLGRQLRFPRQLSLIEHDIEGEKVHQRPRDGYINATELCQSAGKKWDEFSQLQNTKAYLFELATASGIPETELVQTVQANGSSLQETWVHPQVATNLGGWLSPKFAVWVSQLVQDWVEGKARGLMPPHVKRYLMNKSAIPPGNFSMLNEVYLELLAHLDDEGIKLPPKMMPDISTGRMFSDFLRGKGHDPDDFKSYKHKFPDGRVVDARLYPVEHLGDFRLWFHKVWIKERAVDYFRTRLPAALPHIQSLLLSHEDIDKN